MRKSTKKFKKQAKPKPQKLKKINPTKFFPSLEEVKNETEKKRPFESDAEEDFRKKRKKTEFSSVINFFFQKSFQKLCQWLSQFFFFRSKVITIVLYCKLGVNSI